MCHLLSFRNYGLRALAPIMVLGREHTYEVFFFFFFFFFCLFFHAYICCKVCFVDDLFDTAG